MNIDGYCYLHTNGSLIYKRAIGTDDMKDYLDSDFVVKAWPVNTSERETAWIIATEALALGAKKEQVMELKEKWGLTDDDAKIFAKRVGLEIFKDGDQFCAVFNDFINIQESQVGFGDTALEAIAALAEEGLRHRNVKKGEK